MEDKMKSKFLRGVLLLIISTLTACAPSSSEGQSDSSPENPVIELISLTGEISPNGTMVKGKIKNISNENLEFVSAVVTFFDEAGNEVDKRDGLIDKDIEPEEFSEWDIISFAKNAKAYDVCFMNAQWEELPYIRSPQSVVQIITPTPKSTNTLQPSHTPNPTSTPEPTATVEPTSTPISPSAWIWSTTLSDFYKQIYDLGYSAEMDHHEDGYWLLSFNDLNSYFTSGGWWWYGNSILAWAGEGDRTDSLVDQIGLRKNYLDFPTSELDGKVDRFFRNLLEEFGFDDVVIEEIMEVAFNGLVDARNDIGERVCYGQLSSGEYIGVRLLSSYGIYVYYTDIRTSPICTSTSAESG
jgi:hypothetical protein